MLESVRNYIILIIIIVYTMNYNTVVPLQYTIGFIHIMKIQIF